MLASDVIPAEYVGSGPAYPDETDHEAMAENAIDHLTHHLLSRPAQGVGPAPGHGFEHEPVDQAERDAQHTAQTVAQDVQSEAQAPAYTLSHAQVASDARQALRPGAGA